MKRETFKDKAMYLLSGERFLGLPLFESEDIEDYRISDEQGDMPFDDFLDRLYELGVAEGWIPNIVNCSEFPTGSTTKNDLSSELEKNSKKLEKDFGELDCISRQAVDDILTLYSDGNGLMDARGAVTMVRELPSVTPKKEEFEWCDTCKEYDQEKHCCHRWSKVIRNTVEELKEEYIEREVLDKIRAEVVHLHDWAFDRNGVLKIIDKYKAETEAE